MNVKFCYIAIPKFTAYRKDKCGFGLGLAIVHKIIEWHGGSVGVTESTLGGARFCIELPQYARQITR